MDWQLELLLERSTSAAATETSAASGMEWDWLQVTLTGAAFPMVPILIRRVEGPQALRSFDRAQGQAGKTW